MKRRLQRTMTYPLGDSPNFYDLTFHARNGSSTAAPTNGTGAGCQPCSHFIDFEFISLPADNLVPSQDFSVSLWALTDAQFKVYSFYNRGNMQLGFSYLGTLYAAVVGESGAV